MNSYTIAKPAKEAQCMYRHRSTRARIVSSFAFSIVVFGVTANRSHAQCEVQIVHGVDTAANDWFGLAVAIDGSTAVVGAPLADVLRGVNTNANEGAAYIFRRNSNGTPDPSDDTWVQFVRITGNGGASGDQFGTSVSIGGGRIVVGAPFADAAGSDSGSVYVFKQVIGGWAQERRITGAAAGDRFGHSVGLSKGGGSTLFLAVGAPRSDPLGRTSAGRTYVYRFSGSVFNPWPLDVTLTGDTVAGDQFGWAVSASGGDSVVQIIVGAPFDDDGGASAGSAHLYTKLSSGTWVRTTKLWAGNSAGQIGEQFGKAVAIGYSATFGGNQVVVGAPFHDRSIINGAIADTGRVYLFTFVNFQGWKLNRRFVGSPARAGDQFGFSVSTSGDTIAVGAQSADEAAGTNSGAAYFYRAGTNWDTADTFKLIASDAAAVDQFGYGVAVSDDFALIGSRLSDQQGSAAGAVYSYAVGPDGDDDSYADVCDNCPLDANVDQADADADGNGDVCDICPGFDDYDDGDEGVGDGFPAGCDNCPQTINVDQADSDGDGFGDVCDNCPAVPNGPTISTCVAGSPLRCLTDTDCDSTPGSLDGLCSQTIQATGICTAGLSGSCAEDTDCDTALESGDGLCAVGVCVSGLADSCSSDVDCDSTLGAGDGMCGNSQQFGNATAGDADSDGVGDLCDNCVNDDNPNQADFNQNGKGDVCDPAFSIGDELMPPRLCVGGTNDGLVCRDDTDCVGGGLCALATGYENTDVNVTALAFVNPTCVGGASHGMTCTDNAQCAGGVCGSVSTQVGVFYYDRVYGDAVNGWEGRFFVNEPGVSVIQWLDAVGQPVGDPVTYVATDSVGESPTSAPYALAGVRFFANMGADAPVTIDTTFDPTIKFNSTYLANNPPMTPSDVEIRPGDSGFQVNTSVLGKIVIQYTDGLGGALAGLEVVDIREFVAVGVDSAVDVGRKLDIPAGADCKALFVQNALDAGGFPAAWQRSEATLDIWPIRKEITAANLVIAWYETSPLAPNCWHNAIRRYSSDWPADPQRHIVVSDVTPDPPVVQFPLAADDVYCAAEVMFPDQFSAPLARIVNGNQFTASAPGYAVVRFDSKGSQAGSTCQNNRVDVKFEVVLVYDHLDPTVASGPVPAPIGTQLDDVEHNTNAALYPFGYLYVDSSTQPSPPYADNIYQLTGQIFPVNTGVDHGLLEAWWYQEGAYAPGIHWPHNVVTYDAQWPAPASTAASVAAVGDPIIIASRLGAGAYPAGSTIYNVGDFQGPTDLPGWNPNDEHARLLPVAGMLRAYAVRDDNPWAVSSGHPYVLVQFNELVCSVGGNLCLSEFDCAPGESCDPNGLMGMGVHAVIGEEPTCPDPLAICFDYSEFQFECADCMCDIDNTCINSPRDGESCNSDDDCARLPVVAGLPIDPLFPVNIAAAQCFDEVTTNPSTTVVGDGLWVDREGGVWAAEEETDDAIPQPSIGTIYLWENWVADRSCQPWRAYHNGGDGTTPWPIIYRPSWPPVPPACTYPTDPACARPLQVGELVNQSGQVGPIQVLHDSVGIRIVDPTFEVSTPLPILPSDVFFKQLPPHLFGGEIGGGGEWPDRIRFDLGELIFRGIMSDRDRDLLKDLSFNAGYLTAIDLLYTASRAQLVSPIPNPVEKWVSVADASATPGWITLAFQNDTSAAPLPVSVEVWRVDCPPHAGIIRPLQPTCPFNEKIVMQHSVDGGGQPENLIYHWQWSVDYDPSQPQLATWSEYDRPAEFITGAGHREVIIGGASPFTLSDSWWRVRYRGYGSCPCTPGACNEQGVPWGSMLTNDGTEISDWTAPQLAEGWVKRVVRGINPFDQRVKDFHLTATSTYVDMISQAGTRFEAPIALNCTPSNINNLGLIEVYETVARRARSFSIDVGNPFEPAMLAILLVTSKVSDLYTLLGNEAFADASDPTIGLFAAAGQPPLTYDPHAVFSFENQVPTILEEELAMLRGRDAVRPPDLDADGNIVATVYNRFPWNFTSGNGQVAYANNYQVTNVVAARELFPQGHGDAWGHYTTAVKKFYTLLRHPVFDWIVSTESVLVAGQPVQVGFQYERAFAKAAAARARTGAAITSATFRQLFDADPTQQDGYPDTDPTRSWGVVDWARRSGQGAYFDWAMTNALLDDTDDDPAHANTIQKIDRTTVTEIREIATAYTEIQGTLDKADAGLNPLGLAANVVPFGLNPAEIDQGKTHFEQVFERAIGSLSNAVTAFDYANENSRRLRSQQDKVEEFSNLVSEREMDFKGRLVEIFGRPYDEDIGPAKTYPPGYDGPDVFHFQYVEPTALLDVDASGTTTVSHLVQARFVDPDTGQLSLDVAKTVAFNVSTNGLGLVKPRMWGTRPEPGEIQFARGELLQSLGRLLLALEAYEAQLDQVEFQADLLDSLYELNAEVLQIMHTGLNTQTSLAAQIVLARAAQLDARDDANKTRRIARAVMEAFPLTTGVLTLDVTSAARSAVLLSADMGAFSFDRDADAAVVKELRKNLDQQLASTQQQIDITGWQGGFKVEQQIATLRQLIRALPGKRIELYTLQEAINQATGRYQAALGKGVRLLEQRTAFRQKTANDISQYRYRDLAFRVFRNDALQKYRAQFDLAARYAYLAARAFDYETNLLGTESASGRAFVEDVVKERVLGIVAGGTPQTGNGLAGLLADLNTSWSQAKPQLGFNSPDELNRTFSLRWELFRKPNSISYDGEWRDILSSYVVPDLNRVQAYNQYCQPLQPPIPNNPAIVIPLGTTVQSGLNFFGWPSTGDATLPSDRFAIKMHDYGIRFSHYPGFPLNQQVNAYLVPIGADVLRVPSCPEAPIRQWHLLDQTLPVPLPVTQADLQTVGWLPWDSLSGGSAALVRRRLIPTVAACAAGDVTCTDMSFKLTGRSVWNTRWLLIIPGSELMGADPQQGVDVFINGTGSGIGVRDIKLILNGYGYSGCVANGSSATSQPTQNSDEARAAK